MTAFYRKVEPGRGAAARPSVAAFVAEAPDGRLVGFAEASLRPWAEGCTTRPVGYLEGWYVVPSWRGQGIGAALVRASESWARRRGVREMASDTWAQARVSRKAHRALGYSAVETLEHFRKRL